MNRIVNWAFSLLTRANQLYKCIETEEGFYRRKRFHSQQTWPTFHCFGTPIWPPWRHVCENVSYWKKKTTFTSTYCCYQWWVKTQQADISYTLLYQYFQVFFSQLHKSCVQLPGFIQGRVQLYKIHVYSSLKPILFPLFRNHRERLHIIHLVASPLVGLVSGQHFTGLPTYWIMITWTHGSIQDLWWKVMIYRRFESFAQCLAVFCLSSAYRKLLIITPAPAIL